MDLFADNWIEQIEVGLKVLLATFFGGVIGMERELSNKPAGLRTHAILGAAATLLVGLTDALIEHIAGSTFERLQGDPIRVVEAIVTGVAFIGAGTIFRHRGDDAIEGLTTAASLLLVAAVGIAVATGQLLLAIFVTGLAVAVLRLWRLRSRDAS